MRAKSRARRMRRKSAKSRARARTRPDPGVHPETAGGTRWRAGARSQRPSRPIPKTFSPGAAGSGGAAGVGRRRALALALAVGLALACSGPRPRSEGGDLVVRTAAPPSSEEHYCAWYGAARDGVLYFGVSAFWSALRAAGGDPRADLEAPGPVEIGRFDLAREELLPPLVVDAPGARAGVWDVFPHENGRVFFTTYFEAAGWVEPATGRQQRLPALGIGLNEIAPGPDGGLLISRYGTEDVPGSVLSVDGDGALVAEHALPAPAGYRTLPKTVAFDPLRSDIWVTTDQLPDPPSPDGGDGPVLHDAYVLDAEGRVLRRVAQPEIQFVAFRADGRGYAAEVDGGTLTLREIAPPGRGPDRRVLLDRDFTPALDFVQDVTFAGDARVLVSRWSGALHLVDFGDGSERGARLPSLDEGGLYYTAVARGSRVCATYCGDVSVVCRDAP